MQQITKGLRRLKRTAYHATLILYRHLYAKTHQVRDKDIYICVSIDGDLPRDKMLADKAIHHTIKFLKREGLSSKVTWFINDGGISMPLPTMPEIKTDRFCWTQEHPEELKMLVKEGCDIELHSHYIQGYWESNGEKPGYELILKNIKEEKESLESFVGNYTGRPYNITGFRAGAYITSEDLYRALKTLGCIFDSSEVPGLKGSQRLKHCFVDYSDVPFLRNWHYIDDELLELPLYPLTMDTEIVRKCTRSPIVLSFFCGHPFDFIDAKGNPRRLRGLKLRVWLRLLKLAYPGASWVAMRDIPQIVNTYGNSKS